MWRIRGSSDSRVRFTKCLVVYGAVVSPLQVWHMACLAPRGSAASLEVMKSKMIAEATGYRWTTVSLFTLAAYRFPRTLDPC